MPLDPNGFLARLLAPEVALPIAAGLLGQQGNGQNFANALGMAGPAIAQQKQLQAQTAQSNKTLEFLRKNSPDLAGMVDAGMPVNEAWKMYSDQRNQKPADPYKEVGGQLYDTRNGTWMAPPKAAMPDPYTERRQAAEANGLTPDNPAYQSFILTGKMPREDQAPLTQTDKRAILEADEMVSSAQGAIPLLDKALELNQTAYDGAGAGWRGWAAGNLGMEGGAATIEYDNLVQQQALSQLKAIFGAAPTEGERKILMDIAGSSSQPMEVRQGILTRAKEAVLRRQQLYKSRAEELRGGTFYKPAGAGAPSSGGAMQAPSGGYRIIGVEN